MVLIVYCNILYSRKRLPVSSSSSFNNHCVIDELQKFQFFYTVVIGLRESIITLFHRMMPGTLRVQLNYNLERKYFIDTL